MIDLHTHSTCSDGTLSPADLVNLAWQKGISALALTDHDTTSGLEEASSTAADLDINFIPGIELSVEVGKGEFHLLGLGIHKNLGSLERRLQDIRFNRNNRNKKIVFLMNNHGIEVTYEEIATYADGDVIGRPHFAAYLVDKGHCATPKEAFQRYLGTGRPFYMPKEVLTLEEASKSIINAGGLPVVAHPLSLQLNFTALEEEIPKWKALNIAGMETMHPSATRSRAKRLEEMAKRHDFLALAGSDFHGDNLPNRKLGRTGWGSKIPPSFDEVANIFLNLKRD